MANTCLSAIERLMRGDGYFLGGIPTLADLHAAPMLALLRLTPEGERLLSGRPRWRQWWSRMNERPSMIATSFAAEG
jgi:glutathione S-transferase